jgi:hypothetical protein
MSKKVLIFGSVIALLIAAGVYKNHSSQNYGTVRAASSWAPPNCPHGLEPGGGAMRCADPNDPSSYLYKKNKQQAQPAKPQTKTNYTISPDGKEIITPDGKHWARRPDWMPSPQEDPRFCVRETHSASALNRCVQIQNQEFLPSQADYENALGQQAAFLYRMRRQSCIDEHGTWSNGACLHR